MLKVAILLYYSVREKYLSKTIIQIFGNVCGDAFHPSLGQIDQKLLSFLNFRVKYKWSREPEIEGILYKYNNPLESKFS